MAFAKYQNSREMPSIWFIEKRIPGEMSDSYLIESRKLSCAVAEDIFHLSNIIWSIPVTIVTSYAAMLSRYQKKMQSCHGVKTGNDVIFTHMK